MRPAVEILSSELILADGAMGTYYATLAGSAAVDCELANIGNPDLIRRIHQEYMAAGSRLLRTNTFAAAALLGTDDPDKLAAVIRAGYLLAVETADKSTFVAADIGPVYKLDAEIALAANQIVIKSFLLAGAELFIFETFADPAEILPLCQQIKDHSPRSVIIASFAMSADGMTRNGLSLTHLSQIMEQSPLIDIWGFNCGIGPMHMAELACDLPESGKPTTLMPNSGYPRLENQRLIFGSTPDYFAQASSSLRNKRTRLIGGCCGTTPQHIRALREMLAHPSSGCMTPDNRAKPAGINRVVPSHGRLSDKLNRNEFVIVCELDPPRTSQMDQIIASARLLQLAGFDAITLADSPLARVKMESVSCAARISRETGIAVLPHICCRDRNANSLRSSLLAAHGEGIRQILAVTGDAIPESDRGFVKPVFNLNSVGLLQLIKQMNQDTFADDPILAAAALDPGVPNPAAEFSRVLRKKEQGATLFLTQPVFDSQGAGSNPPGSADRSESPDRADAAGQLPQRAVSESGSARYSHP